MKTSTIFAVAGIASGITSLILGFGGKPVVAGAFGLAAGIWAAATAVSSAHGGDDG